MLDTEDVNSKKVCFGRKSEDFAGNRETWEIFRETRSNKIKSSGILRYFGNLLQKFGGGLLITDSSAQTAFVRAVRSPSSETQGFNGEGGGKENGSEKNEEKEGGEGGEGNPPPLLFLIFLAPSFLPVSLPFEALGEDENVTSPS